MEGGRRECGLAVTSDRIGEEENQGVRPRQNPRCQLSVLGLTPGIHALDNVN